MRLVLIAVAGAAGALARYGVGHALGPRTFPWATLGVNIVGSFLLGFVLAGPIAERWPGTPTTVVATGFLGAFTTFSTFAFESTDLLRDDRPLAAAVYVGVSVLAGLLAAALGYLLGRATT